MNTNNLVTIAFPVYERYDFFEEALNSALNQTVIAPIIVVDNASSHDRFKIICNKYPNRIQYYRNENNIGMFPNWNKCTEIANTEYVMIVGDDDKLPTNYIEKFAEARSMHEDLDVFYTNVKLLIHKNGKMCLKDSDWSNIWGYHNGKDLKSMAIKNDLKFPSISFIARRELFEKNPFITSVHTANDKFFIYSLPDDTKFYGNKKVYYIYRMHGGNDSVNKTVGGKLVYAHFLISYKCLSYSNHKLFDSIKIFGNAETMFIRYYKSRSFLKVMSPYRSIIKDMFSFKNIHLIILGAFFIPPITIRFLLKKWVRKIFAINLINS